MLNPFDDLMSTRYGNFPEKLPRRLSEAAMTEAIDALKKEGAVIVDANIPSVVTGDTTKNILYWNTCSGIDNRKGKNANCSIDFLRKPLPGELRAEARVLKLGRSLSVGDVLVFSDGHDGPVARASLTYSIPPR